MARTVIIEGLPQFQRRIEAISHLGDVATMSDVGKEFAASAQRLVPRETSALHDSIGIRSVAAKEVIIGAGGGLVDYAFPVEEGAKAHPIRPRRARLLRFYWDKPTQGGPPGWYAFRKVAHPGTRAQPYFQSVIDTINLATRLKAEVVAKWNGAG